MSVDDEPRKMAMREAFRLAPFFQKAHDRTVKALRGVCPEERVMLATANTMQQYLKGKLPSPLLQPVLGAAGSRGQRPSFRAKCTVEMVPKPYNCPPELIKYRRVFSPIRRVPEMEVSLQFAEQTPPDCEDEGVVERAYARARQIRGINMVFRKCKGDIIPFKLWSLEVLFEGADNQTLWLQGPEGWGGFRRGSGVDDFIDFQLEDLLLVYAPGVWAEVFGPGFMPKVDNWGLTAADKRGQGVIEAFVELCMKDDFDAVSVLPECQDQLMRASVSGP
jgi:hypothetical protein